MGQLGFTLVRSYVARVTGAAAVAAPVLAFVLGGALSFQGCATVSSSDASQGATPAATVAPARPLADAERSPEDLARRSMAALLAGDEHAMEACRITKDEFRRYVWPELPASKLNNVTVDFAWDQASLTSLAGLRKVLQDHGGKRYELVRVVAASATSYSSFKVYNKPVVTVRDERGEEHDFRLFGSILELDGQYKLFGYAVR